MHATDDRVHARADLEVHSRSHQRMPGHQRRSQPAQEQKVNYQALRSLIGESLCIIQSRAPTEATSDEAHDTCTVKAHSGEAKSREKRG